MSIFSTGVISSSDLTGFAVNYAQFPALEIFVSSLSQVSRIEIDTILKFGGAFVGTLGLLLLMLGFKRICGPFWAVVSGLIASTYTNFITMVHGTIGLVFSIILVFGILRGKRSGAAIAVVGLIAMVVSHDFTPLQVFIVLGFASAFYVVFPQQHQGVSLASAMLILLTTFSAWILFTTGSALATFTGILAILRKSLEPALAEAPQIVYVPRMLSLIGLSSYALLLAVGFVLFVLGKTEKKMRIMFALCFGAGGYFIFGSLPFIMSSEFGIKGPGGDVLPRSVEYLYILGAPVAAVVLERLRFRQTPETKIPSAGSSDLVPLRSRASRKRRWAATLLLSIILMPTFYFFIVPMYYDINAPSVQMDVRLPLNEWQTTAEWVSAHSPLSSRVYGDMIAVTFIGAIGKQGIFYIIGENLDIQYLLRSVPSAIVLDRSSSPLLMQSIPFDNLVYSDSGVLIVLVTPARSTSMQS
jgi:hypothetical protein